MHLIKTMVKGTVTTKCGLELPPRKKGEATLWQSDVTCSSCQGSEVPSVGNISQSDDLLSAPGMLYNQSIKQAREAPYQGEPDMARTTTEETAPEVEAPVAETKPEKVKKDPVPEGYVTPVAFAKLLSTKLGKDVRPQIIYGYIKNSTASNPFPFDRNTDTHFIVHQERAFAWYEALQARKAEREAKKAAATTETPAEGDAG